jgi:hypothetical protein
MIVGYFQCFLEHVDCFIVLLGFLVSETLAVEEFGIAWHQLYCIIEVLMSELYFL